MKYIKYFDNINQYKEDKTDSPEIYESAVTYVLSDLYKGDVVKYVGGLEAPTASVMYIDDYPDDKPEIYEDHGFDNWEDYFDWVFDNDEYRGTNKFTCTNETMVYEGEEYYLWEYEYDSTYPGFAYALTPTADYNDLYRISIESNYSNKDNPNSCPVYTFLTTDKTEGEYTPRNHDSGFVLLKVEHV